MATAVGGRKRGFSEMNAHGHGSALPTGHSSGEYAVHQPLEPIRLLSRTGSRSHSPATPSRKAAFDPHVSIVLIGVRGVGKSTLGVLAATAYKRRLIDFERIFLESTGKSTVSFRKENGAAKFQERHREVLRSTLESRRSKCVIICNFSDLENHGSALLQEYAETHPVIHVSRDISGIRSHLQGWSDSRVNDLLHVSEPILRQCSNYEFFNLSEESGNAGEARVDANPGLEISDGVAAAGVFLALKRTERDFLRLLRNIVGDVDRGLSHHSVYPLSQIPVEKRRYTYSVQLYINEVLFPKFDLDEAQIGADCIEVIVDLDDTDLEAVFRKAANAFALVRRNSIVPIIVTTLYSSSNSRQYELIEYLLRLGPEFCTIDLSQGFSRATDLINCKGCSKIIGTFEFSQVLENGWSNERCIEAYQKAAMIGCDLVKITMPATSLDHNFGVHAFRQAVNLLGLPLRLIAYNTGPKGRLSKCFNDCLTPVRPGDENSLFISAKEDGEEGEGQDLTMKSIMTALCATSMIEPMQHFVYGADVGYSLSPAMHNAAYKACGLPHFFDRISSEALEKLTQLVHASDFGGAAITLPYKTSVMNILDRLSPHAAAIGAVNTIVPVRELLADGSIPDVVGIIAQRNQRGPVKALYGDNTDWIGIRATIRKGLSPANTVRPQTTALVCGAGGMSKAAVYSLLSLGVRNVYICNRTAQHAVALANRYNDLIAAGRIAELNQDNSKHSAVRVHVIDSFTSPWPAGSAQPTIIVSCIPTQTPDGEPINFSPSESWLKSPTGGVAIEVAYRRHGSPFMLRIRQHARTGWIFRDGFDTLPEQAFSQFELFTGRRAPRKLMRNEVLKQDLGSGSKTSIHEHNSVPNSQS